MIEISTWSATGSATARDGSGELSLDELSTQTCPAVVVLITCFWLMTPHQATIWWQTMQKKAIHSKSISYMCKSCIESYLEYRVLKLMDWRPISIYSNRPHFQEWAVHTLAFLTIPHCLPHSFLHDGGLVDSQPWRRGRLRCGVAFLRRKVGGSLPSLPEPRGNGASDGFHGVTASWHSPFLAPPEPRCFASKNAQTRRRPCEPRRRRSWRLWRKVNGGSCKQQATSMLEKWSWKKDHYWHGNVGQFLRQRKMP